MTILDDFTGTPGTILTTHNVNWKLTTSNPTSVTDVANWTLQTGGLQAVAFRNLFAFRDDSSGDDVQIPLIGNGTDARYSGPSVRMALNSGGYSAVFSVISGGNYTRLEIRKAGAFFAQVTGISFSQSTDHDMRIVATTNGANVDLEVWLDGVSTYTGTDSSSPILTGNDGMYVATRNGATTFGSFIVATVGPVITDVNTTNSVQVGDAPTVTGTAFGATEGSQTFNAEAVGVDTWADTSIVSDAIVRGDKSYATHDWIVTHNDTTASAPLSVTLAIDTGFQFVNLVDPINILVGGEITSLCYGTNPACATVDQLKTPLLTDQGNAIDISAANGTFVITGAGSVEQTFSFEIWDATGPTAEKWSSSTAAVINGVVQSGGIMRNILRSPLSNILRDVTR